LIKEYENAKLYMDFVNYTVNFSLDFNNEFVSSGSKKFFGIWNKEYGFFVKELKCHKICHNLIRFNPIFQNFFISLSDDRTLFLWKYLI
jgi:WD40 repeat protein